MRGPVNGLQLGHLLLLPQYRSRGTFIRTGTPIWKAGISVPVEEIFYLDGVFRLGDGDSNQYQIMGVAVTGFVTFFVPVEPGTASPVRIVSENYVGDFLVYRNTRWKAMYERDFSDSGFYEYRFQRLTEDGNAKI